MPDFYGQTVDIHLLTGSAVIDPMSISGDASKITFNSDECPSLGASVMKILIDGTYESAVLVDNHAFTQGRTIFNYGFHFHSINAPAISDWGSQWTAAVGLTYIRFGDPVWDGRMRVVDGQCRARQDQSLPSRVTEFEDVGDAIQNGVPVESNKDYFVSMQFVRNGLCRGRITEKGTGKLVGEKSWTSADSDPDFFAIGFTGAGSLVSLPQNLFITNLVFDYSNAAEYPLRDYYLYAEGDSVEVPAGGLNLHAVWDPA